MDLIKHKKKVSLGLKNEVTGNGGTSPGTKKKAGGRPDKGQ